jgi:hypothetical protein
MAKQGKVVHAEVVGGRVWYLGLGVADAGHYPISLLAGMLAGDFGRFIGRLDHQTTKRCQYTAL